MKLDEKDKLIALAYLHQGKKPKEVEELVPNISYAQALRLRKELEEANRTDSLTELFDLEEAALETLIDNVRNDLTESVSVLTGDTEALDGELDNISQNVQGMQILEREMADTATVLVRKIRQYSTSTNNVDTLVMLAEALAKLHTTYFKNNSIQIANFNGEGGSSFERFLKP